MDTEKIIKILEAEYGYTFSKETKHEKHQFDWLCELVKDTADIVKNNAVLQHVSGSCECGEHSKCVRKIHSNSEGRLWVESEEHFKCGKVKKQVNNMLEWWNNYR